MNATDSGTQLHQAFRLQTLTTAHFELELTEVIALLRAANIEPILIKGWSNSRLYPRTSLRPYGDIDLCVPPDEYTRAGAIIKAHKGEASLVDLHRGFATIDRREFADLFDCSQLCDLNGTPVRVLGDEDHLRVLCLHLLRHGAWRPLWLCDVAVALERRSSDFDWQRCLGDNHRERRLVICVIGLAHQLLGAKIDDTPFADEARRLPRWLAPSVLKSWNNPSSDYHEPQQLAHTYIRNPRGVLNGMRRRWRTPVRSSIELSAPFNDLPRLPFQFAHYIASSVKFAKRLPFDLGNERQGQAAR